MHYTYLINFIFQELPVVSRLDDKKVIGIITANDITHRFGLHVSENSTD